MTVANRGFQVACGLCVIGVALSTAWAEPVTTGSLVGEMTDLRRLADYPDPAYETVQFSSYDHRSVLPGGPDWFANSDGFGGEPIPNFEAVLKEPAEGKPGEYLICDVEGPGAIVRTWTAAIKGSIRMWLDDAKEPIYDGSAQEFLFCPYADFARKAGIDSSIFDGTFGQRNAGYYPIPFARRCRIVWVGNHKDIHFYQIQIRRYTPDANLVTFKPDDLKTYRKDIEQAGKVLAAPDKEWQYASKTEPVPIAATVAHGESKIALEIKGPAALERLTLELEAADMDRALRQTVLHIACDGHPWGQVQAPVGDFFGSAPGISPFDSVPFTVKPDGTMTCRFVMPFARMLRIVIDNRGEQAVTVKGSALPMSYTWNDETSMYFRARWRVDHDLIASNVAVQDMPYLIAHGQGVYVGTTTYLLNPNNVPRSGGNWWGEGDEKIFVDDDVQPSTFGTGSEDYYNYAWSSPDIFLFPYCGQPRNDGPANRGFVTNNRWHILDPLPFKRRIAFYMELFPHETTPDVSYARIGYHYARPGVIDDHEPITNEDVRHLELPANWQPAARGQARNSVFHQIEDLAKGEEPRKVIEGNLYSGGKLLVWQPKAKGDELVLTLPVARSGKYAIHLAAARTPDAGTLSVRMAGKPIIGGDAGVIDLGVPYRTLLRRYSSGPVQLGQGEHMLTLRYEGPSARGGDQIGIDFLWVQKR